MSDLRAYTNSQIYSRFAHLSRDPSQSLLECFDSLFLTGTLAQLPMQPPDCFCLTQFPSVGAVGLYKALAPIVIPATTDVKAGRSDCGLCICSRAPDDLGRLVNSKWEAKPNRRRTFARHGILIYRDHEPQRLTTASLRTSMELAWEAAPYRLFFNGPNAGASISDHLHFQFVRCDFVALPVELCPTRLVCSRQGLRVSHAVDYPSSTSAITVIVFDCDRSGVEGYPDSICGFIDAIADDGLDCNVLISAYPSENRLRVFVWPRRFAAVASQGDESTAKTPHLTFLSRLEDGGARTGRRALATAELAGICITNDEEQFASLAVDVYLAALKTVALAADVGIERITRWFRAAEITV